MDKDESKEGSQTCHLCGKVQCGQRLGRVKCCRCKRIFCLQQLSRKFNIQAQVNDPNFICPRCNGICCCVCNCQKPPPHVHCKVYKVRQNKANKCNGHPDGSDPVVSAPITIKKEVDTRSIDELQLQQYPVLQDTVLGLSPTRLEGLSIQFDSPYTPPIARQNDNWLVELNMQALSNNPDDRFQSNSNQQNLESQHKFSDSLKDYFTNWERYSENERSNMEGVLLASAKKLQLKAAKTDVLFRMLETFNKESVQVTVTWDLKSHTSIHSNSLPALYTIIDNYSDILFTLENDSNFEENKADSRITITFMNTSALKDTKSLCLCIALLDNTFRRLADVNVEEKWSIEEMKNTSFRAIGKTDLKVLKEMVNAAEKHQQEMKNSTNHKRISVSYKRSREESSFENLPLISLILKRIHNEYKDVVFSLCTMVCDEEKVECVLEFSTDQDWISIIKGYESSIEVCEDEYKPDPQTPTFDL